eukprot:4668390-Pyramimonas_sp.AAC.1
MEINGRDAFNGSRSGVARARRNWERDDPRDDAKSAQRVCEECFTKNVWEGMRGKEWRKGWWGRRTEDTVAVCGQDAVCLKRVLHHLRFT